MPLSKKHKDCCCRREAHKLQLLLLILMMSMSMIIINANGVHIQQKAVNADDCSAIKDELSEARVCNTSALWLDRMREVCQG